MPELDPNRAVDLVMQLLAIPGGSGDEGKVARFIRSRLGRAGVPASAFATDQAHKRSALGGTVGNLIVKLPGSGAQRRAPRRMLSAHLDTVPICLGCEPVLRNGQIRSAIPDTGLGADDRSGVAAVLSALLQIRRHRLPYPPLTLLFTVQEEVGLMGAHHVAVSRLGSPALAFNFDGGSPAKLTIGATGGYRMTIDIRGIASHAGVAPEDGVSASTIGSMAIAQLRREGWLGRVSSGAGGTSNVGVFNAGEATNVVTDKATLKAEVRSHDKRFRKKILNAFVKAFQDAARSVSNADGKCGKASVDYRLDYEAFALGCNEPCVRHAEAAIRSAGGKPTHSICDGGLDANWLCAHGIPTVTLGAGAKKPHMVGESLDVKAYLKACQIALVLATG